MSNIAHPNEPHTKSFTRSDGKAGCSLSIDQGIDDPFLRVHWADVSGPHSWAAAWPSALPVSIPGLDPELLQQVNAHLAEYAAAEKRAAAKAKFAAAQERVLESPANRDVLNKLTDK